MPLDQLAAILGVSALLALLALALPDPAGAALAAGRGDRIGGVTRNGDIAWLRHSGPRLPRVAAAWSARTTVLFAGSGTQDAMPARSGPMRTAGAPAD